MRAHKHTLLSVWTLLSSSSVCVCVCMCACVCVCVCGLESEEGDVIRSEQRLIVLALLSLQGTLRVLSCR